MIKKIVLAGIFVLITTLVFGEYYQYTDENGKLRFTDDISTVPAEQRKAVQAFKSKDSGSKPTDAPAQPENNTTQGNSSVSTSENNQNIAKDTLQGKALELNSMQTKLNEIRTALESEQATLQEQLPKEGATTNEKIAYSTKVEALNARIAQYEKELKVFNDKVDEFNSSKKNKSAAK